MAAFLEHYRVLGISYGAGIKDVTSSYRRLCRIYHPDINKSPGSEEQMKRINIAYTVLRDKLRREAAIRERQAHPRPARRYGANETRSGGVETKKKNDDAQRAAAGSEAEAEAYSVLNGYFRALNAFDYSNAYNFLSSLDQDNITRESFIEWRESVARLYPMREFKITGGLPIAAVSWENGKSLAARKFRVAVTEGDSADETTNLGDIEKLVINEEGAWKVFLGYRGVGDLTRRFDEQFETKCKRGAAKRWEEYSNGICTEYDMLNMEGLRKAASREMYRQRRFGGSLTFAVVSVKSDANCKAGLEQLRRSAARTVCKALRETDISAYAGDGIFALLFVELNKMNADEILRRLVESIRKNAGHQLSARAEIEFDFESWDNNAPADFNSLNATLKKFQKKL